MIDKAKDLIKNASHILIAMHKNPDADAIGSALALFNTLKNITKCSIFNDTKEIAKDFDFLPEFKKISNNMAKKYDLLIVVDSANMDLVGQFKPNSAIINIDHHKDNLHYGTINYVKEYASCAEVVYDFLNDINLKINRPTAKSIYAGIVGDTIFFTTNMVSEGTFEKAYNLVKLGADPFEIAKKMKLSVSLAKARLLGFVYSNFDLLCDARVSFIDLDYKIQSKTATSLKDYTSIANELLSIVTVVVSVVMIELEQVYKISLRSKSVDVSKIATKFGGGAHKFASSCLIQKDKKI